MPRVTKQTAKPAARKPKGPGVIGRIEELGENTNDKIKINIYGKSGTGKTTLWATFPKPILAIICSGGKRPGELRSIATPDYRKTVHSVVLESSGEIQELVAHQESSGTYATIVLDHASGLQDLVLKEILGLQKLPEQLSWGLATQQQYGQVALQVKERLRSLLDLDCNVVIVAQEREFNTSDEASELLTPYVASSLTPSIVGWLNPAVDFICQTFKRQKIEMAEVEVAGVKVQMAQPGKGVDYCLRVGPHSVYETKFRIPLGHKLLDDLVNPTYDKIIRLIRQ